MRFVDTEAKKTFEPVTLIVESADELYVLWHRLNASPGVFLRSGYAHKGFDHGRDRGRAYPMWQVVDAAAKARDVKVRGNA